MSIKPVPDTTLRFTGLIEEYGRFLRRAVTDVRPEEAAAGELEETARQWVAQALATDGEMDDLTLHLYRAALPATLAAVRGLKQAKPMEAAAELSLEAGDEPAAPEALVRQIADAAAPLPDNRRTAIGLHLEGLTPQEIAELLGWTELEARNQVYRGLREIRQHLRDSGIEYEIGQ